MAKFNSTRNKYFDIWTNQQNNEYTIVLQQNIKESIENSIDKINKHDHISSIPYTFEDDFKILIPWYVIDEFTIEAYQSWTIEFPFYPEYWIKNIKPIILRKYGEDSTGELEDNTNIKENFVIGIEDLEDTTLKKVIINVGVVFRKSGGIQDDIQVKLLMNIPVPNITI